MVASVFHRLFDLRTTFADQGNISQAMQFKLQCTFLDLKKNIQTLIFVTKKKKNTATTNIKILKSYSKTKKKKKSNYIVIKYFTLRNSYNHTKLPFLTESTKHKYL